MAAPSTPSSLRSPPTLPHPALLSLTTTARFPRRELRRNAWSKLKRSTNRLRFLRNDGGFYFLFFIGRFDLMLAMQNDL